ncbi:MAG: glycine cleavage system protein R [Akkermansiaceae bacterium]
MPVSTVLNIHAHDRPGIMSRVSKVIKEANGNWLESRMARLAGQFAGIVRVECETENLSTLKSALTSLADEGIHIQLLDRGDLSDHPYTRCLKIDIFGNDRPGIVSQLTQTVSAMGANIEELNTTIESAPMAGHPVFHASGTVCLPDHMKDDSMISAIENLSDDLSVEIGGI